MARSSRLALLALALVVLAVVAGRGVYELGLGLHVLSGGGTTTAVPEADEGSPPAGPGGLPASAPDAVPEPAQAAVVDRVVDGDTIRVRVDASGGAIAPTDSARVRLLNVDAPELDHPERGEDCGATEATAFVEALTPPGSVVWLVADTEDRDRYDRPLRGVFTDDGTFVNAELVRRGWAEVVLFPPNDRFHAPLLPLEEAAREAGHGVWRVCDGFPS